MPYCCSSFFLTSLLLRRYTYPSLYFTAAFLLVISCFLRQAKTEEFVLPITKSFQTCSAIIKSSYIYQTFGTIPFVFELDYSHDPKLIYENEFGRRTTLSPEHRKNYECVKNISAKINGVVNSFIRRVDEALSIRMEAYGRSIRGRFDETRPKRDLNTRQNETDVKIDEEKLDEEFHMTAEGPLEEFLSSQDQDVTFSQSPYETVLNQNKGPSETRPGSNPNIALPEEMFDVPNSTTVTREKRASPLAVASIVISLSDLALSVSTALYFSSKLEKLQSVIGQLVDALDSVSQWTNKIKNNVVLLKNEATLLSARVDSLYGALERLGQEHACEQLATSWLVDFSALAANFDALFQDLVSSHMTTRVISIDTLKKLLHLSSIDDNMMLSSYPLSFYARSSISLLSADKTRQTVRILVASPRVAAQPDYNHFTILTTVTSVKLGDHYYDRELILENPNLAIPVSVTKQLGFDIRRLNMEQISKLRIPLGCGEYQAIRFCRDFIPLQDSEMLCIQALIHDDDKNLHHCKFRMTRRAKHTPFSIAKTTSGSLVSASGHYEIYGWDLTRSVGHQRVFLSHAKHGAANLGSCFYVTSIYSSIELVGKEQNITISQNTAVSFTSDLVHKSAEFSIQHMSWFDTEIFNFSVPKLERFAEVDKRMGLHEMDQPDTHIDLNWGWSYQSILLLIACFALLLIYMVFLCKCGCKWWRRRLMRGGRNDDGGEGGGGGGGRGDDAIASGLGRARQAINGNQQPPYALFRQNDQPQVVINAGQANDPSGPGPARPRSPGAHRRRHRLNMGEAVVRALINQGVIPMPNVPEGPAPPGYDQDPVAPGDQRQENGEDNNELRADRED